MVRDGVLIHRCGVLIGLYLVGLVVVGFMVGGVAAILGLGGTLVCTAGGFAGLVYYMIWVWCIPGVGRGSKRG